MPALPDLRSRLSGGGAELGGNTPDEFERYVKSEIAKWARVVKLAGAPRIELALRLRCGRAALRLGRRFLARLRRGLARLRVGLAELAQPLLFLLALLGQIFLPFLVLVIRFCQLVTLSWVSIKKTSDDQILLRLCL